MASHFCIGHVVDMRLMDLYLYIFLMHMDVLLWFYYVSLFIMLWNSNAYVMYYYTVCIFRHDYALCYDCMFPICCYGCANLEHR